FVSRDHETGRSQSRFDVVVFRDELPTAELTVPAKDPELKLPANGILQVEAKAGDDYGITNVVLKMRVVDGPDKGRDLPDKQYRRNLPLKFSDGTYPKSVDYKDIFDFEKLASDKIAPINLRAGDRVECWLEVTDNCDYPEPMKGQVAKSEPRYVTIVAAEANPKKMDPQ